MHAFHSFRALGGQALAAACLLSAVAGSLSAEDRSLRVPHQEPAQALKSFHVLEGFRMELLAAEPLLADPVAAAYDERGRAWVVEMSDYPYTDKTKDVAFQLKTGDAPLGKVRVLEDVDGDGRFDRSTLFADRLSWPTGIALFDGGAFVAGTPDIVYLKDTEGDGRADVRRRVFTGFRKMNVQAVINNLIWGLDQKIYAAGATNGGEITCPEHPERPAVIMTRADFRFDPRTLELELISGGARFGNSFDDWGNRFICNIRNPIQQVVLPARYLARNRYLPLASAVAEVAEGGDTIPVFRTSPVEPWRVINASRIAGAGDLRVPRSESNNTYVTSSTGVTIYRGNAYPEAFRHQAFIGEVAGNLIHRELVVPDGVAFKSRRIDVGKEFVTSDDNWFRPVNFVNAPDGTLHVLDMYRETIEHPWSIPDDIKARLDLESGRDRGRMYRLAPPGFAVPQPPQLGRATTAELVALLAHPNAWHRETAQRLLFERGDRAAVPGLQKLLATSSAPLGRLHALWTLNALGALDEPELLTALSDAEAGVRRHAVLLAEPKLSKHRELIDRVLAMADDKAEVVRFQVALSLGEITDPRAAAALGAIARRDAADPWMRAAVLSSTAPHAAGMLAELVDDVPFAAQSPGSDLVRELAFVVGAQSKAAETLATLDRLAALPDSAGVPNSRASVVLGLGEGARRGRASLPALLPSAPANVKSMCAAIWTAATKRVLDPAAPMPERLQALRLVSLQGYGAARPALAELIGPRQGQEMQLAAVRALSAFQAPDIADLLLSHWRSYTPALRVEVVEAMLARPERIARLLGAVAAGTVPAAQISPTRRTLLLAYRDPQIRRQAEKVLGSEKISQRADVISQYKSALALAGDAARGAAVFKRECSVCHRLGDAGHDVGPNLATILHRSPEQLLVNVLDPNREVAPSYVQYTAVLDDGRVATGIIAGETPASITLKRAENVQETILRENIDELASTGMSLMPEGMEKKLDRQNLADLLAYLQAAR